MRKTGLLVILCLIVTSNSFAQRQGRRFDEMLEKYKAERVSYLTGELKLSVSEAEKFWPVYNEYQDKREALMRESRPDLRRPDPDSLTIDEKKDLMDAKIQNDVNIALLAQEYHKKFVKLLGVEKVFQLYHSEQEFMGYMIRKMRGQEGMEPGPGQGRGGREFNPNGR